MQILQTSGSVFRTSDDFLQLIKTQLCVSLSRNGVSSILELFEMALYNFLELIDKFKSHLKIQIEVRRTRTRRVDFLLRLSGFVSRNFLNDSRNSDEFISTQMVGHSNISENLGRCTNYRRSFYQLRLFITFSEYFRTFGHRSFACSSRTTSCGIRL